MGHRIKTPFCQSSPTLDLWACRIRCSIGITNVNKPNPSDPNWDCSPVQIPLTRGYFATVDESDFHWLSQWKWSVKIDKSGLLYARRHKLVTDPDFTRCKISMHRALIGSDLPIDHRDGNGLNNQRANLRIATRFQNKCNSATQRNNKSGFRGVCWYSSRRRWVAQICLNRMGIKIGSFKEKNDAIVAYAIFSLVFHGEFSFLHRPQTKPPFELLT